jgi:hypothetical protein
MTVYVHDCVSDPYILYKSWIDKNINFGLFVKQDPILGCVVHVCCSIIHSSMILTKALRAEAVSFYMVV